MPRTHGGSLDRLAFRLVRGEGLADLEQGDVAEAAVRVALGGLRAGPAAGSGACRRARPRSGWRAPARPSPPPNSSASSLRDERPGDGLHQPAHGERAARQARALLDQGQDRLCHRSLEARQGFGHDAVDAGDADDLLDQIRLALDVRTPGRRCHARRARPSPESGSRASSGSLRISRAARRDPTGAEPRSRGIDDERFLRDLARERRFARLAAAQVDHQLGGHVETRQREGRIDAALEAVTRIGDDAELAAGLRDVQRIPEAPIRSARRSWSRRSPNARRP